MSHVSTFESHDASEQAYAAVVHLRVVCTNGDVQVALITSKTKVAPIKKLTIPGLELCGAVLLAQLFYNVRQVFELPITQLYAWTDSTIVLSWLNRDPKRFKTYVCNRVSNIVELIGPDRWRHVCGAENPANCASRGLFPSEILHHELWWNGPDWLKSSPFDWPYGKQLPATPVIEEIRQALHHVVVEDKKPVVDPVHYSSYT